MPPAPGDDPPPWTPPHDDPHLDNRPLDEAIAADLARRLDRAEIVVILARCAARAAAAGATWHDHLLADDWRRVLAARDGSMPLLDPTPP